MLIVFAFSITPTILLHDLLANHTDTVRKQADSDREQVGKKLYYCYCDNIVAESPFTDSENFIFPPPEQDFCSAKTEKLVNFFSNKIVARSLRGPPVI